MHTRSGGSAREAAHPQHKLAIVPHGPLRLRVAAERKPAEAGEPYTFVLFGELKPYKGIDLLIEAVSRLPAELAAQARFVVAGRPRMDLGPARSRIAQLGLENRIEIRPSACPMRPWRSFLPPRIASFPYRQSRRKRRVSTS